MLFATRRDRLRVIAPPGLAVAVSHVSWSRDAENGIPKYVMKPTLGVASPLFTMFRIR